MRDAMRCLYESTREYPATQTYATGLISGNDTVPMDVSAVLYGKGKGKKGKDKDGDKGGRGKATDKFDGDCGYCGKWGHKRADCRRKTYAEEGMGQGC